tara:strand:+ start:73 stop:972 length:900 start_codon:yes stop_codon:yes gene_type:complete
MYKNGLIIINQNCNITSKAENLLQKIFKQGNTGMIVSLNPSELINVFEKQDHVIVAGGDGTIFSILQLIFDKRIPIAHFPIGTGNGLYNSIIKNKEFNLDSIYNNLNIAIQNDKKVSIDTMTIKFLNSGNILRSFLFISCGIFSNIDLKSEWLRFLGELRFTIGGIIELTKYFLNCNKFNAELEYSDDEGNYIKVEGMFVFFLASNLSHTSKSSITSPYSRHDDGFIYLSYLTEPTSTFTLLQILLGLEDGSYINKLNYVKTKWFRLSPETGIYDIDGEKIDSSPIDVSINPSSMDVLI